MTNAMTGNMIAIWRSCSMFNKWLRKCEAYCTAEAEEAAATGAMKYQLRESGQL